MEKPTNFEFTSYKFEPENRTILFNYRQNFAKKDPVDFTEKIIFPEDISLEHIPSNVLDKVLQGLHFVIGVSYYKFYCATKISHNYAISKKEADFWNTVYKNGMGEFYFRNKLDPNKAPKFTFDKKINISSFSLPKNNRYLVALSGGKDSIVAAELLKEKGIDITAIFTETNRQSNLVDQVAKVMGVNFFKIQRFLDAKVFEKHNYDGHVPVSAIYAFLGIFYAILYKYSYFVVANEFSSNFGNIKYKEININHQWSKSEEFENLFIDYVNSFISPDVKYFSLLRSFYEIRIAEMFSKYEKYFQYFSSCNKNFKLVKEEKRGLWCGECPKCVFSFTLLSAFIDRDSLIQIFNKNLYQDAQLLPLFRDIMGIGKIKPFDCVGTFEESKVAFMQGKGKFRGDYITKNLEKKIKINEKDLAEVFKTKQSRNIPVPLRLLGLKNILILGYGKEGIVSERFIKKEYPEMKIIIADKNQGKDYLKLQNGADFAIRTAGLNKSLVKIPYTTATNLFFSKIKESKNKVIGVTGSKGKSTTASLIYEIIKNSGRKVSLVGNIGSPMLATFLGNIDKDEIFVVELSSYQLDDIEFSPDISVITNLFEEHMDYHGGSENYFQAKMNIVRFQNKNDIFVYNGKNKIINKLRKGALSQMIDFSKIDLPEKIKTKLVGKHNEDNIRAAICVARELGIQDEQIYKSVSRFEPLSHRMEFIGEYNGIKFYDDAISTSPESTILAIESLKFVDTIFLGGEDRGYNFSKLEKVLKKHKINNVVLFPNSGNRMKIKAKNILKTKKMEDAVSFAYKFTKPGKICLLSCASPSYSLWKNFEEKGDQFKFFVEKLSNGKKAI